MLTNRLSAWLRWLAVFVAAGAIYWCSDLPVPGAVALPIPQGDKLLHLVAYAVFAALVFRALRGDDARPAAAGVLALGAVLATAYGVSDEFHQLRVPGREFSVLDMLADGAGATLAALVWPPLTRRFARLR